MKTFKINDNYKIHCYSEKTRYGFRHLAFLTEKGNEIEKAKRCYYNRTWESFEYKSVIEDLLEKSDLFSKDQQKEIMEKMRKNEYEEINKQFSFVAIVAKLGEIFAEGNQKESNKWKEKMIKAGLGEGIIFPEDWDSLNDDEKEKRLDAVIKNLEKPL